jgi:D-aminopeptidase
VGVVRDAVCSLAVREKVPMPWLLPVVVETYDGWLSDTSSFPVTTEHAIDALDAATIGRLRRAMSVAELA